MSLIDVFFRKKRSAVVAKERLSIILAHERAQRSGKDFISALKEELIAVICKYTAVDKDALQVTLDRRDSIDVLKVDVVLPEGGLRRG
ncbi:MAG TPA: cell division topological specificity factor MinE [Burkholderiales bacterium]|nr:cell division topological specificity factor MinE [Burkholderiales bacterium]